MTRPWIRCFNEAAGIHRRKRGRHQHAVRAAGQASMRPPEFTGGNIKGFSAQANIVTVVRGFNEAAGIHRRKHANSASSTRRRITRFNEAAGIHRRKLSLLRLRCAENRVASMRPPEFTGGNVQRGLVPRAWIELLQ